MDGAASDLRTGLPWQMVEIHEPVRSLFIIETTPEAMLRIMDRERRGSAGSAATAGSSSPCSTPRRATISVFQDGEFRPYEPQAAVLPKAPSSVDWYRGWRDHLEFAEIERLRSARRTPDPTRWEPCPIIDHLLRSPGPRRRRQPASC